MQETYFADHLKAWYTVKQVPTNEYLAKIDKFFQKDLYSGLCKMVKQQSKLSVVIEGDAWQPNFLIKENNGIPENAVLTDSQLSRFVSQISLSLSLKLFEYYQYFSGRVQELGTDKSIISLIDLREDIEENSHVGLTMAGDHVQLEEVWNVSPFKDDERNKKLACLIKQVVHKKIDQINFKHQI
nr:unnamed protein product [Callosobruchus analis]